MTFLKIEDFTLGLGIGAGAMFIYLLLGLIVYFIPTIAAYFNNHKQFVAIFMLNLFGGWTVLGWVTAIVWAFVQGENQARPRDKYPREREVVYITRERPPAKPIETWKRPSQESIKPSTTKIFPLQSASKKTQSTKLLPPANTKKNNSSIKSAHLLPITDFGDVQNMPIVLETEKAISEEIVHELLKQLKDPNTNIKAFTTLNQHIKAVIPILNNILKKETAEDLEYVVWVLGEIGCESKEARAMLLESLYSSNKKVLHYATQAIKKVSLGKKAVPPLIKMLQDSDEAVRRDATEALGEIGESAQEAIPLLIKSLNDTNFQVRLGSMWALGNIGQEAKIASPSLLLKLKEGNENRAKVYIRAVLTHSEYDDGKWKE